MRAADLTDGGFPEGRRRLGRAIELDSSGDNRATREAMRLAFDEERPYRL